MQIHPNTTKNMQSSLVFSAILALTLSLVACGGDGGSDSSDTSKNTSSSQKNSANNAASNKSNDLAFNANIAKDLVDTLAIPAYGNFASKSAGLPSSIQAYCDAIGKSNETSAKASAQNLWKGQKNDWQALQIYNLNSIAQNGSLSKAIYTKNNFGSATTTAIANQVAKRKADANYSITNTVANNARGFDALEYLLFSNASSTSKKHENCDYAVAVANDINKNAKAIATQWTKERSNILTNKEANGVDLVQPFFNNFANSVDVEIKTNKIAIPSALKTGGACASATCPELVEHKLSKTSYDSIKANLQSLKAVFNGGSDGTGFRAFYTQKKMQSQAQVFEKQIDDAIATVNAQNSSLYDQLVNIKAKSKASACASVANGSESNDADLAPCKLYYQVKKISDDVKSGSFKLAVSLTLPSSAAGDGD